MTEERKPENVWNAERILYAYIYDSDDNGYLPYVETLKNNSYKIGHQRFYAALRAYGKDPEWFYRTDNDYHRWYSNDVCCKLLSNSRSEEKMSEFRELVKKHFKNTFKYEFMVQTVDSPDYLKHEMEINIVFGKLMEYRKKLYAVQNIWSGMLECSKFVGTICSLTRKLNLEYIFPMCQELDKMIVLLMGDDYDRTIFAEDLGPFGYPDVSDEDFDRMIREDMID